VPVEFVSLIFLVLWLPSPSGQVGLGGHFGAGGGAVKEKALEQNYQQNLTIWQPVAEIYDFNFVFVFGK